MVELRAGLLQPWAACESDVEGWYPVEHVAGSTLFQGHQPPSRRRSIGLHWLHLMSTHLGVAVALRGIDWGELLLPLSCSILSLFLCPSLHPLMHPVCSEVLLILLEPPQKQPVSLPTSTFKFSLDTLLSPSFCSAPTPPGSPAVNSSNLSGSFLLSSRKAFSLLSAYAANRVPEPRERGEMEGSAWTVAPFVGSR